MSVVESNSLLGVLVREVKRSIVLLNDVARAAPRQMEVDHTEAGVLGGRDFLKVLG